MPFTLVDPDISAVVIVEVTLVTEDFERDSLEGVPVEDEPPLVETPTTVCPVAVLKLPLPLTAAVVLPTPPREVEAPLTESGLLLPLLLDPPGTTEVPPGREVEAGAPTGT